MARVKAINFFRNYSTINNMENLLCRDSEIKRMIEFLIEFKKGTQSKCVIFGDEKSGKSSILLCAKQIKERKKKELAEIFRRLDIEIISLNYKVITENCKSVKNIDDIANLLSKDKAEPVPMELGVNVFGVLSAKLTKSLPDKILGNKKKLLLIDDCDEFSKDMRERRKFINIFKRLEMNNSKNEIGVILVMSKGEYNEIEYENNITSIEIDILGENEKKQLENLIYKKLQDSKVDIKREDLVLILIKFNYDIYEIIKFLEFLINNINKENNFIINTYKIYIKKQYKFYIEKYKNYLDENQKKIFNIIFESPENKSLEELMKIVRIKEKYEMEQLLTRIQKFRLINIDKDEFVNIRSEFVKDCFKYNKGEK